MLKDLNYDISAWWNEQSFAGKDSFKMNELGALTLLKTRFIEEKIVGYFSLDNADVNLKFLQEKFLGLEAKVHEIEVEWGNCDDKLKLADKIEHSKRLLHDTNAIGSFDVLAEKIQNWEEEITKIYKNNLDVKMKLVEQAESLADSENWKDTVQAFRDISEQWKSSGHLEKNRGEKLFQRVEAARKKFHERKRLHHEDEEKDLLGNLDLKIEIIEKAESIANSEDWKTSTEIFHKLMEDWKNVGRTVNKRNEELWQRLVAAKNTFFDRKKAHFNEVQHEQEANYVLKMALVEKAESLKESKDWGHTAQAFAKMMEEWKKIGKVPFEKSEEIWKRFNDAYDYFSEARKQHSETIRSTHEQNYQLKMELLNRAEELKDSNQWNDTTIELNELLDKWKQIGPVSREHSDKIWNDFLSARKHFFERKDANREQRKQFMESRNKARQEEEEMRIKERAAENEARKKAAIEDAKNKFKRFKEQIIEEQEKIADFEAALLNITPGKKAAELKAHLENLISESKEKLQELLKKQPAILKEEAENA